MANIVSNQTYVDGSDDDDEYTDGFAPYGSVIATEPGGSEGIDDDNRDDDDDLYYNRGLLSLRSRPNESQYGAMTRSRVIVAPYGKKYEANTTTTTTTTSQPSTNHGIVRRVRPPIISNIDQVQNSSQDNSKSTNKSKGKGKDNSGSGSGNERVESKDLKSLIDEGKHLNYTNHVISRIQKSVFAGNDTFECLYNLFTIVSRCSTNNSNRLFSVYDIMYHMWFTYTFGYLSTYLSSALVKFVTLHLSKLHDYRLLVSGRESRYTEIISYKFYDSSKFSSCPSKEWSDMKQFKLWSDMVSWERDVLDRSMYNVEDVNDPYVVDDPCNVNEITGNSDYNQLYDTYTRKNPDLASRYDRYVTSWYENTDLESPMLESEVSQYQYETLLSNVDGEIAIWNCIHRILTQCGSQVHKNLVEYIKNKNDVILLEPVNRYSFIGINNSMILNLETLTKNKRRGMHNIRKVCEQNYNPNVKGVKIDTMLMQMSGNNKDNLEQLQNTIGMSLLTNPNYPIIVLLTGKLVSRKLLCKLYSATYPTMTKKMELTTLSGPVDMELRTIMRDNRFIIVNGITKNTVINADLLSVYFERYDSVNIDGKHYYNNVTLFLEGDSFPVIDSMYEAFKDNILLVNLHDVESTYRNICEDTNEISTFFVRSAQFAHNVYNNGNMKSASLSLSQLPLSLPLLRLSSLPSQQQQPSISTMSTPIILHSPHNSTPITATVNTNNKLVPSSMRRARSGAKTNTPSSKQQIQPPQVQLPQSLVITIVAKETLDCNLQFGHVKENWSSEKQLVAKFIMNRMNFDTVNTKYKQSLSDIKLNFNIFISDLDTKYSNILTNLTDTGFGMHLSYVLDKWKVPYSKGESYTGEDRGKRVYLGIATYDVDLVVE